MNSGPVSMSTFDAMLRMNNAASGPRASRPTAGAGFRDTRVVTSTAQLYNVAARMLSISRSYEAEGLSGQGGNCHVIECDRLAAAEVEMRVGIPLLRIGDDGGEGQPGVIVDFDDVAGAAAVVHLEVANAVIAKARPEDEGVVAASPHEPVVAGTALERVGPTVAVELVVLRATVEGVGETRAAIEDVGACLAIQRAARGGQSEGVGPTAAPHRAIGHSDDDLVIEVGPTERLNAVESIAGGVAGTGTEIARMQVNTGRGGLVGCDIGAQIAVEDVGSGAANQHVIATAGVQRVVSGQTVERVVAAGSGQGVITRCPGDRAVSDVGDGDCDRLRVGQRAIRNLHDDVIDVVGAGVAGRLEVGRGDEAQYAGRRNDRELSCIGHAH